MPLDEFVESLAAEKGYDFVQIHDLGNDEQMKAVGKFGHAGVAAETKAWRLWRKEYIMFYSAVYYRNVADPAKRG